MDILLINDEIQNFQFQNIRKKEKEELLVKRLYKYYFQPIQKTERLINEKNEVIPKNYVKNLVENTNYNCFTFIPKFIYKQFNSANNLFYLFICFTQFFKSLRVVNLMSIFIPLMSLICFNAVKEIYEEIKKYLKDKKLNTKKYLKYENGKFVYIKSEKLKVGDIIKLKKNDRVPCDLVFLWSKNKNGITNVKTDQVDGETDWKIRKSLSEPQKHINKILENNLLDENLWNNNLIIEPPNDKLYSVNGVYLSKYNNNQKIKLENTIWANMKIMTDEIIGVIVYVGKESKLNLNLKSSNIKYGLLEKEINKYILLLFLIIFILTTLITWNINYKTNWCFFKEFLRVLNLISALIPISLKANMEFGKFIYIFQIANDKSIEGTVLKNSNIVEDLARVDYLLTDKTGTLTQNKMTLKTFALKNKIYNKDDDFDEIKNILINNKEDSEKELLNFFEFLILCHNVTPIKSNNERTLQSSSPDEISLIKFIESQGYELLKREENLIQFKDILGKIYTYEVVENFNFSSERKRMGIIIKYNNKYKFLLKGADCVINNYLKKSISDYSFRKTEDFSKLGFRTLVFAEKIITESEYLEWKAKYLKIQTSKNYEILENRWIEELENGMDFIGVTGVEDLWQDNVKNSISNIRKANIKVWMLTGDKAETAKCIATSTGFKYKNQNFLEIIDINNFKLIFEKLIKYNGNDLLLISGTSLEFILKNNELKKIFINISLKSNSVIICRCLPKQKSEITLLIKNNLNKIVLTIGDGGNDVAMIKSASFGIGIEGLEGKQAALSSDASIKQFKYIENLLFWNGRLCYLRTCKLFHFSINRGALITFIQIYFMLIYYYSSITFFNSELKMMYSSFFTTLLIYGILLDEDIKKEDALKNPKNYMLVKKGRYLNLKQILKYLLFNIYQSFILYLYLIYKIDMNYAETKTFITLIFIISINTLLLVNKNNYIDKICIFMTFIITIMSYLFLYNFFSFKNLNRFDIISMFFHLLLAILPYTYKKLTHISKILSSYLK